MRKKIAIVGSGISGLMAAHCLQHRYDITLFEKNDYLGGHTHTHDIQLENYSYRVDTGFIVCNDKTYPNFLKLLDECQVQKQKTEMSFSYCNRDNQFEYNGHSLYSLFSDRKNLFNPSFYRFIFDILKFNHKTKNLKVDVISDDMTIIDFVDSLDLSGMFKQYYFMPMIASIWSSDVKQIETAPAKFILGFLQNHGLLQIFQRPQWYSICHGSNSYVEALRKRAQYKICLNEPVHHISRLRESIRVETPQRQLDVDYVVMATHSDEALASLKNPSIEEAQTLARIPYQANTVVLHTDPSAMPKHKRSWASWNFIDARQEKLCLTYYMNKLQSLTGPHDIFVTVNPTMPLDESKILKCLNYAHPCFQLSSSNAQANYDKINGKDRIFYCGAYWYNGFHEDGVRSALAVAEKLGVLW